MSVIGPVQSSTCQKSFNFVNAFACYKQKCKLARFNMAHPVFCKLSSLCRNDKPVSCWVPRIVSIASAVAKRRQIRIF